VFFARSAALPVESAPAPSEAGAEEPASDVESESNETPPAGTEVALDWRLPEPVEELEGALGPEAGAQETEEPPVAGKGWTSLEDEALETVTEPEYEIVEVEPETIVEVDAPTAAGIADLKARIEETRRRIRQELDQPFADKSELVAGEEAVVPAAEAVEVPEEPAAETFADAEVADAEVADSGEEPAFFDESVETFEESSEIFASTEAAVSELESTAPPEALETTETLDVPERPAVSEAIEAPLKAEPEIAEPGPQEPSSAEPEAESEAVPEAPETEEAAVESVDMLSGDGFDHEAMRRRIEETRSRLKAKAFDAMMKGESSLLGRDEEGESDSGSAPDAEAHVDNEVAETIDSALSEEDF
jgi:hypothetical protein